MQQLNIVWWLEIKECAFLICWLLLKHRHIHAPEVLEAGASDEEKEKRRIAKMVESEEDEEEDELSDEEIDRRRQTLREKVLNRNEEEEVRFELCFSCSVLMLLKVVSTISLLLCRKWKYWTKRRKVSHLKRAHLSHQNTRSTLVGEKINLLHLIRLQ
jgi:hypothetical protein